MAYAISGTISSVVPNPDDATKLNVNISVQQSANTMTSVRSTPGPISSIGATQVVTLILAIEKADLGTFIPGSAVTLPVNLVAAAT